MRRVISDPNVTGAMWTAPGEDGWKKRRYKVTVKTWDSVRHWEGDDPADRLRRIADELERMTGQIEVTIRPLEGRDAF